MTQPNAPPHLKDSNLCNCVRLSSSPLRPTRSPTIGSPDSLACELFAV